MNFKFFESDKKTFKYLAIACGLILLFIAIFLVIYSDAFYTCMSDDVLQYFKMSEGVILKLKTGNLSFYCYNSYLGASFFADTYYVPIDIFTFFTAFLSFFMNFEIAFGLTEIFKLFLGTMMFAYFLKMRKFSNKAIFITSLLYMFCGYNTTMMAFSAFFSLVFYFPFAAVCIEYFKKGKRFLLPICAAMLLFYNYYLGACTMLFMAVWYLFSYILDNKLIDVKKELLEKNPNTDKLTIKALRVYILRALREGVICVIYMLIGIMIASIILIPSVSYVTSDALPRTDTSYYPWSFDAISPFTEISSKAQYARVFAELLTPSYSTGFYAFNNSYITDHISLYITVTGLIIVLYVFQLKDRDSWLYKLLLVSEVILLAFPIFYMLFSLNSAPYTRWIGMINMFNLIIMAHVITKTNMKLKLTNIWSLIRSALLIFCIIYIMNYFTKTLYDVNPITFLSRKIFGGELNPIWENNLSSLTEDVYYLAVAIAIIAVLTLFSVSKISKKFDIMPYVLAGEFILAGAWMFTGKFYNKNSITNSNNKVELNKYLDEHLEIPYDGQFSRTTLDTEASDKWIYSRSFTRTNLHLSDLRIFHSFYDDTANDFVNLVYDKKSFNSETRNSKAVIDKYSFFVHQLLGTKYVVLDDTDDHNYLPSEYFVMVEGSNNGKYVTYENKYYSPFMIYDTMCPTSVDADGLIIPSDTYFGYAVPKITKQQYLLNRVCYTGEEEIYLKTDYSTIENTVKREYSENFYEGRYDEYDPETNMYGYYVSNTNTSQIPDKGLMFIYYNTSSGVRGVEFGEILLEYEDGRKEEAFDGYAFYEEIPKTIWIEKNRDVSKLNDALLDITVEYCDYSEYEKLLDRMEEYNDLSLVIDDSKLHLSYTRNKKDSNVVALPISYNDDWKINNDYKIINVNGGFLGVIIPEGKEEVSFTLEFVPKKLKTGAAITICGTVLFACCIIVVGLRVKKNEKNIDHSSVL